MQSGHRWVSGSQRIKSQAFSSLGRKRQQAWLRVLASCLARDVSVGTLCPPTVLSLSASQSLPRSFNPVQGDPHNHPASLPPLATQWKLRFPRVTSIWWKPAWSQRALGSLPSNSGDAENARWTFWMTGSRNLPRRGVRRKLERAYLDTIWETLAWEKDTGWKAPTSWHALIYFKSAKSLASQPNASAVRQVPDCLLRVSFGCCFLCLEMCSKGGCFCDPSTKSEPRFQKKSKLQNNKKLINTRWRRKTNPGALLFPHPATPVHQHQPPLHQHPLYGSRQKTHLESAG